MFLSFAACSAAFDEGRLGAFEVCISGAGVGGWGEGLGRGMEVVRGNRCSDGIEEWGGGGTGV